MESIIKPKLTFFEEQIKMHHRDSIVFSEYSFYLVPEVFDYIDMVFLICKEF
jgi:hypothetical protein